MKMRNRCLLVLLCCMCALCGVQAKGKSKETAMKRVYMYGFAASFLDSVAYITDVQMVDSAFISPHGYLEERSLYSMQMSSYLDEKLKQPNLTCAVMFGEKKKQVIKEYMKVRKRYLEDANVKLEMLTRDEFAFRPEEHYEQVITVVESEEKSK